MTAARFAWSVYLEKFRSIRIVRMFSTVKPGLTSWSFIRLRSISPAPISSMKDTATCATTSAARTACRPPGDAAAAVPVAKRGERVLARAERGDRAEHETGEDRHPEREEQDRRVDRDLRRARREALREGDEQVEAEHREQQADRAAGDGEHRALGQELTEQPRAAGPERRPHGELAIAAHEPRDEQIRHTRADDQQDESRRRKQDDQRRLELLRQSLPKRRDGDAEILGGRIGVRIGRLEPLRDHRAGRRPSAPASRRASCARTRASGGTAGSRSPSGSTGTGRRRSACRRPSPPGTAGSAAARRRPCAAGRSCGTSGRRRSGRRRSCAASRGSSGSAPPARHAFRRRHGNFVRGAASRRAR